MMQNIDNVNNASLNFPLSFLYLSLPCSCIFIVVTIENSLSFYLALNQNISLIIYNSLSN